MIASIVCYLQRSRLGRMWRYPSRLRRLPTRRGCCWFWSSWTEWWWRRGRYQTCSESATYLSPAWSPVCPTRAIPWVSLDSSASCMIYRRTAGRRDGSRWTGACLGSSRSARGRTRGERGIWPLASAGFSGRRSRLSVARMSWVRGRACTWRLQRTCRPSRCSWGSSRGG